MSIWHGLPTYLIYRKNRLILYTNAFWLIVEKWPLVLTITQTRWQVLFTCVAHFKVCDVFDPCVLDSHVLESRVAKVVTCSGYFYTSRWGVFCPRRASTAKHLNTYRHIMVPVYEQEYRNSVVICLTSELIKLLSLQLCCSPFVFVNSLHSQHFCISYQTRISYQTSRPYWNF